MIQAWRLVKAKQAAQAFSGQGARLYGGRWNFPGVSCVYLSDSLALAAMEFFIHLSRDSLRIKFVAFPVEIPPATVTALDLAKLPRGWRQFPALDQTKALGGQWITDGKSAVLKVPSAIMPPGQGYNYLLNPDHADYSRIKIGGPQPFSFDPRMWK